MRPRPTYRDEAGFSLLEVMVAVAIFALTVMTLFVVRGRAVEQAHLAKNVELAQRYGKLLLEDILLGNRIYTDGDAGTFEPPDAKNLSYEIAIEEVTVAGTPPDEDEERRSRGAATVGGRREAASKMDDLFGGETGRKKGSSKKTAGADSGQDAGLDAQEPTAGASGGQKKNKKKGGGGGGLFGGEEEEEPEILFRVTVTVHYPVLDTTESLTLETFVPPPPEEGEDEDETGGTKGKAADKQKAGERGGKQGGGKGKRGRQGGAENDLFGG